MSIRRLSGVIAIVALSRLFLGGVSASCALVAESANSGHAHSGPAAGVDASQHDESASCDAGGAGGCHDTHDDGCLTMSSCSNALASERCDPSARVSSSVPTVFVAELLLEPSRVPEPPPPRA